MSFCVENESVDNGAYLSRLSARTMELRVPLSGAMALTDTCNLHCVHCYCGPALPRTGAIREMTTHDCFRILDELTEAGCLYLLLTGGEPLLRPDFAAIYSHAKRNGLMVTVFTNGTLITADILRLFSDLPPRKIEISLYGATASTHDGITGSKGSFVKAREAIEQLLSSNLTVFLKTVLMTRNKDEFKGIEKIAADYGIPFRYDPCVFPQLGGQRKPLLLRLSPDEIARTDLADQGRISLWQRYYATRNNLPRSARLYGCRAGITSFWIDSGGDLQPCVMVRRVRENILNTSFHSGWKSITERMNAAVVEHDFACNGCSNKALCGYCPGFFELETGSETERSEFLCEIGQSRRELLAGACNTETKTAT